MKFTKETWRRVLRTFVQAAIGYIAASISGAASGVLQDTSTWQTALFGLITAAIAAGLAAVMNLEAGDGE